MIVTIQADTPRHAQFIEFQAMLAGLPVDVEPGGRYLDVTVRDTHKVLGVIKRAGGKVFLVNRKVALTKEEMFVK